MKHDKSLNPPPLSPAGTTLYDVSHVTRKYALTCRAMQVWHVVCLLVSTVSLCVSQGSRAQARPAQRGSVALHSICVGAHKIVIQISLLPTGAREACCNRTLTGKGTDRRARSARSEWKAQQRFRRSPRLMPLTIEEMASRSHTLFKFLARSGKAKSSHCG